jgi:predicted GIY-YIG superfamily endonuclease
MQFCYALSNNGRGPALRQYIGYTVDPPRRLRQHNREIRGGAWKTRRQAGEWDFTFVLTCLDENFGKHEALSLEWHLQHAYLEDSMTRKIGKGNGKGKRRRCRRSLDPNVLSRLSRVLSRWKFKSYLGDMVLFVDNRRIDEAWVMLYHTPVTIMSLDDILVDA